MEVASWMVSPAYQHCLHRRAWNARRNAPSSAPPSTCLFGIGESLSQCWRWAHRQKFTCTVSPLEKGVLHGWNNGARGYQGCMGKTMLRGDLGCIGGSNAWGSLGSYSARCIRDVERPQCRGYQGCSGVTIQGLSYGIW